MAHIAARVTSALLVVVNSALAFKSSAWAVSPSRFKDKRARVLPFSTNFYHLTFYRGTAAKVVVEGDANADLDLYVYDEVGNLVADPQTNQGGKHRNYCVAHWAPSWTGVYRIEVVNRGSGYNAYCIATT